jgi:hypothetical protein
MLIGMLPEQELLIYHGVLQRPAFQLWAQGATILEGLYDALSPFGLRLEDIRSEATSPSPAEQAVAITSATLGTHRFRLQGMESTLYTLSEDTLRKAPEILAA